MRTATPEEQNCTGYASDVQTSVQLEKLVPRLVLEGPEKPVFVCQGTVLHVRLTGMDTLVSSYERGGPQAASELSGKYDAYISCLVAWIERFGGDLLELSLSDLLVVFRDQIDPAATVTQALGCALAMREGFSREIEDRPNAGGPDLSLRMGVASGAVHGVRLGDAEEGYRLAFTGVALEESKNASSQADHSQILLQPSSGARIAPEAVRTMPSLPTPAIARVDALLTTPAPAPAPHETPVSPALLKPFVPPGVRRLMMDAPHSGIFRKLCTIEIVAEGLDPTVTGGLEPLIEWYSKIDAVIRRFDGFVLRVEVGRTVQTRVVFGALDEQPDEESRALQCALGAQRVARDLSSISEQRIGVSHGVAFTGLVGGHSRWGFAIVGERLKQAAALVGHAGPWEILVDRHTVSRSGFGFDWGPPPPVVAGTDIELRTARVLYGQGAFGAKLTSRARGEVVGRELLKKRLTALSEEVLAGKGWLVCLNGNAGIGKSALLNWLACHLQAERHISVYVGECNALIRQAPYHAWIPVFRAWLDLSPDLPLEASVARVTERVGSLDPDLLTRLPLLETVTGLPIPDNASTQGLEAARRRDALHALVLEMFSLAHAKTPLALVFEDIHWMDPASLGLLRYLARNIKTLPILVAMSKRPRETEPDQPPELDTLLGLENVVIENVGALELEALIALACRHLGSQSLSEELQDFLIERASGIPLGIEEMTLFLRDSEQVRVDEDGCAHLVPMPGATFPGSIEDVILARVAQLDEGTQLTLKAASVVGRTFSLAVLQEIYPVPFDMAVLTARLERVEGLDIVRRNGGLGRGEAASARTTGADVVGFPPDATFFFKHSLIRDAVYNSLTASSRRTLHESVAQALERRLTNENRDETVLMLAEHYRRTSRVDKQRKYFHEAGEVARRQALNNEALEYLTAAEGLSQLAGDREAAADILESEVAVLSILGERDKQRAAIDRWQEVVGELKNDLRMSDSLRAEGLLLAGTGDPMKGLHVLERARRLAVARKDPLREARAWRAVSSTHFQMLDLPAALEAAKKALSITTEDGTWKDVVSDEANVGTILTRMHDNEAGRRKLEDAFRLCQEQGDVRLAGIILTNIGVLDLQEGRYDQAIRRFERSLVLKRQIGERQEEMHTLGNLGVVWQMVGGYNEALGFYLEAQALAHQVEERWAVANVSLGLGLVYVGLEHFDEARAAFEDALAIAESCNAVYLEVEAWEGLARLENRLGHPEQAARCLQKGLELKEYRRLHLLAQLAWTCSLQGDATESLKHAAEVELILEKSSPGEDTTVLVKLYLALTYRKGGRDEAVPRIIDARSELMERLERIGDREFQEKMVRAVPEYRRVLDTYEEWTHPLSSRDVAEDAPDSSGV